MNTQNQQQPVIAGAICGMLSVISYLIIAFTDLPVSLVFLLAMLFPILGIVFIYSIREFIAQQQPSHANTLSFVFGSLAFTLCAILLSAQLGVQTGVKADSSELKTIKESLRMIDMGIDVAWDLFIGTYLILFLAASQKIPVLKWWGLVLGPLGLALIVLNVLTFPYPPADEGLFDLGPFIGLGLLGLSIQMLLLGLRSKALSN